MEVPAEVLQWLPIVKKHVTLHPILEPAEILAIIWSESTGNPNSINPGDPSYGLMQITLPIAKFYGGITVRQQLFDPDRNISIGSAFLADLKTKHQEQFPLTDLNCGWPTAYNEGETNESKHIPDPKYMAAFLSHLADLHAAGIS
jgi:hypothetical protein